jgi:hypothetical protein
MSYGKKREKMRSPVGASLNLIPEKVIKSKMSVNIYTVNNSPPPPPKYYGSVFNGFFPNRSTVPLGLQRHAKNYKTFHTFCTGQGQIHYNYRQYYGNRGQIYGKRGVIHAKPEQVLGKQGWFCTNRGHDWIILLTEQVNQRPRRAVQDAKIYTIYPKEVLAAENLYGFYPEEVLAAENLYGFYSEEILFLGKNTRCSKNRSVARSLQALLHCRGTVNISEMLEIRNIGEAQ